MIKVGIDHRIFFWQQYGGISRYFVEIAKELIHTAEDVNCRVVAPFFRNSYLSELPRKNVIGFRCPYITLPNRDGSIRYNPLLSGLNDRVVKLAFNYWKPDVVHETYYSRRPVARERCPSIVTVYDMITETCAEDFDFASEVTADKKATLQRASHIVCISNNTRDELIDIFNIDRANTSVVYLGVRKAPDGLDLTGRRENILLYVGNRSGYKNFINVVLAYGESQLLRHEFELIAFGGGPFSDDENLCIESLNIPSSRIRHIEGNDCLLKNLYKRAGLLVFPSLHEGFGLPLIEAMNYGCPVVCSNTSVMPEICGSAAEYFDPNDYQSIQKGIESVVCSKQRSLELSLKGKKRAEQFTWGRCAEQTLAVYRTVAATSDTQI